MKVNITYFKNSGKYYDDGEYESSFSFGESWKIYDEVRAFQSSGILPGLSSGKWEGYILVNPEDGVREAQGLLLPGLQDEVVAVQD